MITGKIDVTKIIKDYLFKGKSGTYLDVALIPNKDGQDRYGNNGMIVQSVPKEVRQSGIKGPILGNYVIIEKDVEYQNKVKTVTPASQQDDIPF